RREIELPGLGVVVLTRSSRAGAAAPTAGATTLPDVGVNSLLPLERRLPHGHATRAAVYRVHLRGELNPSTALVQDDHQEVRNVRGSTFELHVHPVRPGEAEVEGMGPGEDYLGSSWF